MIAENNQHYLSHKNGLYTKDGNALLYGTKETAINILPGVEVIADFAFYSSGINAVNLPSSLKVIGESAFENNSIDFIHLPLSLEEIYQDAFNNNSLNSITIPQNVFILGSYAFSNNNIMEITFETDKIGYTQAFVNANSYYDNSGISPNFETGIWKYQEFCFPWGDCELTWVKQ